MRKKTFHWPMPFKNLKKMRVRDMREIFEPVDRAESNFNNSDICRIIWCSKGAGFSRMTKDCFLPLQATPSPAQFSPSIFPRSTVNSRLRSYIKQVWSTPSKTIPKFIICSMWSGNRKLADSHHVFLPPVFNRTSVLRLWSKGDTAYLLTFRDACLCFCEDE